MTQFEIELRGPLTTQQKEVLDSFLSSHGTLVKEYQRTQWCFGLSLDKKIDLRIKTTNRQSEFSLKVGKLGNPNRKEVSIPIPPEKVDQSFEFLKFLGHREGVKAVRNAKVYLYKDIEWAIVEVPGHSYYFEAEKLVGSKKEGQLALKQITSITEELSLRTFSPEETIEYIRILDQEANKKFNL